MFCEKKKILYFLFRSKSETTMYKSDNSDCYEWNSNVEKKADDMNRAIPESNYEKTKQKICNSWNYCSNAVTCTK